MDFRTTDGLSRCAMFRPSSPSLFLSQCDTTSRRLSTAMARFLNGVQVRDERKRPRSLPAPLLVSSGPAAGMRGSAGPGPAVIHQSASLDTTDLVSDEHLAITVATLQKLASTPHLMTLSRFRPLRTAMFPLGGGASTSAGSGSSSGAATAASFTAGVVAKISSAVSDGRWRDAMLGLKALQVSGEVPKLGSVQRWVRDCDVASVHAEDAFRVLDMILRVSSPEQIGLQPCEPALLAQSAGHPVIQRPPWIGQVSAPGMTMLPPEVTCTSLQQQVSSPGSVGTFAFAIEPSTAAAFRPSFRLLHHEKAADRSPPNGYDMNIYTADGAACVALSPDRGDLVLRRVDVPHVTGAFFLQHLLSVEEAWNIVRAAESVGFHPDVPMTDKKSILAHNFVWLPHTSWMQRLFDRCRPYLPPTLGANGEHQVCGINARFRCYRYTPGAVYRAHVDGAWPPAGIDAGTGKFVHDTSDDQIISRLTMVIYLNEGFDGGCTTFFTPAFEDGRLNAFPVKPCVGCALVFPHGDTQGSLVHEGSAVLSGVKYIIRTEVLYQKPVSTPRPGR